MDQALINAKLKDAESTSGIAQYTRYSERPWKSEMVMMHELLYAIACRRAQGNRVCSEDQTHLPERLKMDGPGMVCFSASLCCWYQGFVSVCLQQNFMYCPKLVPYRLQNLSIWVMTGN